MSGQRSAEGNRSARRVHFRVTFPDGAGDDASSSVAAVFRFIGNELDLDRTSMNVAHLKPRMGHLRRQKFTLFAGLQEPGAITLDAVARQAVRAWSVVDLPPPPLPDLTRRQFRLGLLNAGLLDAVDAAIEALPEPDRSVAKIEYGDGARFVRTDPWIAALADPLGLAEAEIDALWRWAAGL